VSIPIFSGFRNRNSIQISKLQLDQAETRLSGGKNSAKVSLYALINTLNNYQEIIPIQEEVLLSAEEDLKLAQQRYELGSASILVLLDAQLALIQASSSLVRTKYDAAIQVANLDDLLGTLDKKYEEGVIVKKFLEILKKNKFKALAGVIVLAIASTFFGSSEDGIIEVSTMELTRKDISSKVVADGVLQPETEVKLSANNTTYITAIAVKEGDFVQKGDFLMSLDDRQQKAATEASKAGVEATKVNLNNAEIKKSRQEELYRKGLISDQEMENSNSSYASALSSFNSAEARYIQDEDALSKLRLIAPQDGTITFIDGEVGDLAQGGMFNPSVLLKLSDLSKMEVYVNVNENDIADISINDTALVEVDAYQDKKFKGVVKEVAYAATTSSGGSSQQVTNFEVKIQMLEVVDGMRPGMSATVEIITEERNQVLVIPIQSLTTPRKNPNISKNKSKSSMSVSTSTGSSDWSNYSKKSSGEKTSETVVFVIKNGKAEQRTVETGIVGERDYEVTSGLEEGEAVVTGGFVAISRELYDGAPVKMREKSDNNSRPGRKRG
jgi:HlyD family secretion protein